ncbi:MAG TPA: helix-turn-helix transcriptional regulator [Gammaproteobacteria bacterium]|nr:helix-turn-helix transcriptional regulator [Gammaproteobacteria bacterium]
MVSHAYQVIPADSEPDSPAAEGGVSHYYTAVEKILAENKTTFTPKLIDFEPIEREARKALADNLCLYRKSVNLPQARMARIFGVSLSQYKKYETGEEIVRVDLAQKWSLRFNTPFFYLLEGSGYGRGLTSSETDNRLNFIWFLANSLSDEYFSKLIDVLCTLTGKPRPAKTPEPTGITREHLHKVIEEIDNQMYIAIAYGMQAIRNWFGGSQQQFAELMGVSLSTYQQYEKPVMKPRFSIFIAARYGLGTGVNPLLAVAGTRYAKVRYMQNERMALIREIVSDIPQDRLTQLKPFITGFAGMAKQTPGALIVDT